MSYQQAVDAAYARLDMDREIFGLEPRPKSVTFLYRGGKRLRVEGMQASVRISYEHETAENLQRRLKYRPFYEQVRRSTAMLLRQGGDLSEPLKQFIADVLEGKKPPKATKAPNDLLIFAISAAVHAAKDLAASVYRNDATEGSESACDAVVEAAKRLGIKNLTYDKVAHRYRQSLKRR